MDFKIRKVRQGDALTLAAIQTTSWKTAFGNIISESDMHKYTNMDKVVDMYTHLLDEHIANGYIGELDGKAHSIAYWDRSRDHDMKEYAEIICIHSLPDHWGKGYGRKMMDRLLTDICEAGYQKVMLWVFAENERARTFYKANGFIVTDKVQWTLGAMEVCYSKQLGEEKWVVAPTGCTYTKEEIMEQVKFQEQYFQSEMRMG